MKRKALLTLLSVFVTGILFAQAKDISGVVTDEQGEALLGVSVSIQGTAKGTITDLDGKYMLAGINEEDELLFSYIGYESQTITVGSRTTLDVQFENKATELDEVVVVGYGSQRRSDISTAVSSVNMSSIENSGSSQTLQALEGKISGVQISSTDGSLAGGMTFKVRGVNSITGGTQPLFVIDGFPITSGDVSSTSYNSNPLLGLNPNDIESMEVLKDAAAAAIYGANGSNGVIIINTKKGAYGTKPKISLSYTGGVDVMPDSELQVLSPEDYAHKMYNYTIDWDDPSEDMVSYWEDIIDSKAWNNPTVHNWLDEITQVAQKHDVNASISGGGNGTKYMASVGYYDTEGVIRRSEFNRFTSRVNLQQEITKKLSLDINASFSKTKNTNPTDDSTSSGVVLNALRKTPYLNYDEFGDMYSFQYADATINSPLVAVEEVDIHSNNIEFLGKAQLNYKVFKDLTLSTSYAYRGNTSETNKFYGENTWYGKSESGRMELSNSNSVNWVYEARAQYNKQIGKHSFSAMAAFEASEFSRTYRYQKATGFEDTLLGIWGINAGLVTYAPTYTISKNSSLSYLGRVTYNYDNRYIVNASVRRDGSSKFGSQNAYGNFPAISAAWRASNEDFVKNLNVFSDLRVRASFGMTGNKQIPSYQAQSTIGGNKVVFDGDSTIEIGRYPTGIANEGLKWESQKQYNFGIDASFLNNKVTVSADYYNKRIDDMLLKVNLPSTSGYSSAWMNSGSMKNSGFDFSITAHWFTGDFNWSTDFNISSYKNKILSLADGQYQQFYTRGLSEKVENDVVLQVGMPVGLYYGYVVDGLYKSEADVFNSPYDVNAEVGEVKVADVNGDGVIDSNDRTIIGNVNPLHTGGIGNTLSYKNFDLYVFFKWSYGNDVINANRFYLEGTDSADNIIYSVYDNLWSEDNPTGTIPCYGDAKWGSTIMRSDLVEDGSFLRLQTLSFGYTLPSHISDKLKSGPIRIGFTGSNLWLWSKYSGFDPEANTGFSTISQIAGGFDRSAYPRSRSYSLSITANF